MDPDYTLEEIRQALRDMGEPDRGAVWFKENSNNILKVIEGFDSLDNWLSNGGYLPVDWTDR